MAKFKIGEKVTLVDSMENGVVIEIYPAARGRQLYKLTVNGEDKNCLESSLVQNQTIRDPFEKIKNGIFSTNFDFTRINTSFKIRNTSNNTISSLKASNTIFKPYQFKPLLKFLNSDNRRLLIADEVGLGKTIEAGHIMLELMARRELRNALIVCPKSLQQKWKAELKEKFNFDFRIYESKSAFLSDIKDRGASVKAIINYEKIRKPKSKENELFQILVENQFKFDFLLCDEAHKLRNSNTQTFKGLQEISEQSNAVLFLTATPIMISEENLFNLLRLLDNQQYSEYSSFQNELVQNKPFIKALSQINNGKSFIEVKDNLAQSKIISTHSSGEEFITIWEQDVTVKELYEGIPLYNKIISDLNTLEENPKNRVKIQSYLTEINELNKIFSRTRKKEVTQDMSQAVREPQTHFVKLHPDEREEFDKVIEEYIEDYTYLDHQGERRMEQGMILGLIQKKRQIASSVFGYLDYHTRFSNNLSSLKDAKFEKLNEIINEVVYKNGKKLIVFALFKKTLNYLYARLKEINIEASIIHGGIQDRNEEINRFKTQKDVPILLSSEVGSEGLDMQFCDALVNYDLPWNPMVVEQRIGRIDRFGQKADVVNIYNLIVKNSIQEDIYSRLLDRIGIFKGSIGDLEAILDKDLESSENNKKLNILKQINNLERELYCTVVSEEERTKKIDFIKQAIERENENLKQITEGLTDSLTNDAYFKHQIEEIQKANRYVTEKELYTFLKALLRRKLPTFELKELDKNQLIYRLIFPQNSPRELINFLDQFRPEDLDYIHSFEKLKAYLRDKKFIDLTFSQEAGYEQLELMRVNAYHPLIIAALAFFQSLDKEDTKSNTFQFDLNSELLENDIKCGEYVLAIYTTSYLRKWFNKEQKTQLLTPILYNIEEKKVIEDQELTNEFFGKAQLNSVPTNNPRIIDEQLADDLLYVLSESIDERSKSIIDEQKMLLDSHKKLQLKRKEQFYDNKIKMQSNIFEETKNRITYLTGKEKDDLVRILPVQEANLRNLYEEKDSGIQLIESSYIKSFSPSLISLSHINLKR